jgi:glycosyltransferase involved in cell wall biosynthesis
MSTVRHIGLGLGRIRHWHDGLGEFSRQLGFALAGQAPRLAQEHAWRLHFHLPRRWHGLFGDAVGYLDTRTTQRWVHVRGVRFDLWHTLHQHNRLLAPLGTRQQVETVHDLNFLHVKGPDKIDRYRRILHRRLQQRDAAITITHHVAADLSRELPSLATPVRVIHNGATDLTGVVQTPPAAWAEVPDAAGFLLHISRMAPTKNIEALLALAAAWPEQVLVLAGASSPYTDTVRRQVAERGLSNVRLCLDLDEGAKAWLYAHCRGFLFPSFAEGFGLPPIEAMHFGKSVFLSRLTSLPEVGGDVAHYFDDFDGAAMRAAVEAGLLADARPGRADAIRAHALQFSWERCATEYLGLYADLLDPPARTARTARLP